MPRAFYSAFASPSQVFWCINAFCKAVSSSFLAVVEQDKLSRIQNSTKGVT